MNQWDVMRDAADGKYARNGTAASNVAEANGGFGPLTADEQGAQRMANAEAAIREAEAEIVAEQERQGIRPGFGGMVRAHLGEHSPPRGTIVMAQGWGFGSLNAWLFFAATVVLAALAATQGYVSWHQQFVFILGMKPGQYRPSIFEAFGLDASALGLALTGIVRARNGRRAYVERAGVVACATGSMIMNLLGANLSSPGSIWVYVMPPLLFAFLADRFIASVREAALRNQRDAGEDAQSPWRITRSVARAVTRPPLIFLRLLVDRKATLAGVKQLIINAAPLPEPAVKVLAIEPPTADDPEPPALPKVSPAKPPKRAPDGAVMTNAYRLIQLMAADHDLKALTEAEASKLAEEYAEAAGYGPGSVPTAKRVMREHVRALHEGVIQ